MYSGCRFLTVPLVDVCPGGRHVVVDLCDLVRVVVAVKPQQFVRQQIGFIHLTLPLPQIVHEELGEGEDQPEDHRQSLSADFI